MDWISDHTGSWSWPRITNGKTDIPYHVSHYELTTIAATDSRSKYTTTQSNPYRNGPPYVQSVL